MKILLLVKFYYPFDRGGSEWSTHDLAKLLAKNGHQVTILTPNYGTKKEELLDGINIYRMPFYKKLTNPKDQLAPFWTNNIFWFILTSLFCLLFVVKYKFDIIHIHSNDFLPAGVITGLLTAKPSIATFRDYQVICNLGFCLWKNAKTCNWFGYLKDDFSFFYKNYVLNKNPYKFLFLVAAAIRARVMQKLLCFFAKRVNCKIAVSQKVANIFRANGISCSKVIHNPVIVDRQPSKRTNDIIYIGRFSKGKGIDLYFNLIPQIAKALPKAQFKLIGAGYLKEELIRQLPPSLKSKVVFTGQLDHNQVLKIAAAAALVVVPSVWPEPLPRSAIEAVLLGTPVVATNVGGIGEVVVNNRYGILADSTSAGLAAAIIKGFQRRDQLAANIQKDLSSLKRHFSTDTQKEYERIYKGALAR